MTTTLWPAPASSRELMLALGEMPAEFALETFLDRFDYRGVTPRQAILSTVGKLPDTGLDAPADYDARQHFGTLLASRQFQGRMIVQALNAFPEKKRLFFVHVPKCAGTDLTLHLRAQHGDLCLEQYMMGQHYLPTLQALWQLRALASQRDHGDTLVVVGHIRLRNLVAHGLIRTGDTVFSIIRDPIDMALSLVNYGLTMLATPPSERPMVHHGFADLIGLKPDQHGVPDTAEACRALARSWLHDPKVVRDNMLCHYLGEGSCESALALTARTQVELTTVSRYGAWLPQRWGVTKSEHANASKPYLSRADLDENDLAHLGRITREDAQFYQRVDAWLAATGHLSLSASTLS